MNQANNMSYYQNNLNQNNLNHDNVINNNLGIYCVHCNFTINRNANSNTPILCNRCYVAYCQFYDSYSNALNLNQNMANFNDCLENHFNQNHGGVVLIQGANLNCSRNHHYNLNDIINALRATQNHMNFRNM